jgi:type IV pilus assembly protein PilY1
VDLVQIPIQSQPCKKYTVTPLIPLAFRRVTPLHIQGNFMKNTNRISRRFFAIPLAICVALGFSVASVAAPPGPLDLSQSPLFYGVQQKPIVMLSLTKDHQLHFKAYTDYSDLDGDGSLDLTYRHSFNYYGYWDAQKCYTYDVANGYFTPDRFSATKYCGGTAWSGNFLNWVATSRLDSVRKILYGGKRSTDNTTATVLERSFLPMDAHSWAKFYDGADLNQLIPTTVIGTFTTSGAGTTGTVANGNFIAAATAMDTAADYIVVSNISARVGDQIKFTQANQGVIRYARVSVVNGTRLTVNIPNATVGVIGPTGTTASTSSWQLENMSATGVSFCNTTFVAAGSSNAAAALAAPPLIRVARGNVELWAANERWQCQFLGEKANNSGGGFAAGGQNGNYFPLSGLKSNAESPPNNTTYKVADYRARVLACVDQSGGNEPQSTWSKREGCKQYGTIWKPVGVLQKNDGFKFGLFTGSYAKNISGGVLRSNAGDFTLEYDAGTGVFNDPTTLPNTAPLVQKGSILKTIDSIRMTGYSYDDGTYIGFDGDCTFQLIDLVPSNASGNKRNQGACSSWGNPIAEMYTESIRYLAGGSADPNFTYTQAGSVDEAIGLKLITWQDPLNASNYCVPLKNIIFNAATTSYDGDQVNVSNLAGAASVATYTDTVGTREGITGGIAGNLSPSLATNNAAFNACTNKIGTLSKLRGICPEGAPYSGSYLTAGAAYYARNNQIRTTPAIPATAAQFFPNAYKVETFGVSLANNTPKIDLYDKPGGTVLATVIPAYRLPKADGVGGGTIVDFKIIEAPDFSQTVVKGSYYINWEDSGFGGDFDQDVLGRLAFTWNKTTNQLSVTTSAYNQSTANPQGFGYVLSGTNVDGPHFHSGILGFSYTNPVSNVVECNNCQVGAAPTTQTYTVSGAATASLKDPLYYAAKWGAIPDPGSANDPKFDTRGKKDASGNDLPDGVPDNYFNVSNPAKLAEQLETLFVGIGKGSSSSSAAASTTRASSDALVFTASFNGDKWSGTVKAFTLDVGPPVKFPEEWDAGEILNARSPATRKIFSTNTSNRAGIVFDWTNLSATQQTALVSQNIQRYIAGFRDNEGTAASNFRVRTPSVLGDIVTSNPAYASDRADFAGGFGSLPGYEAFAKQFDTRPGQGGTRRTRALYVGANDGMLHAFVGDKKSGNGGAELFAYVPSMIYNKLPLISQQSYTTFGNHRFLVDGSPFISDANAGTASTPSWKTVLISGLGAGGAGYFALDVTRPESFDASKVMWEFTAGDAIRSGKSDLGASTGQARITRSKSANGETWYAVFGNGYDSTQNPTNGNAVLFVAKIGKGGASGWSEGSDFYRVVLSTQIDNGLSTPTVVDFDQDGFVDLIYAGDLQGNLWRIDARDPVPTNWVPTKIFTAQAGQRITIAPQVTRHPNGGLMVMFGTGKYLEASDVNVVPPVQSMYGIIDKTPFATAATQTISNLNAVPITNRTLVDASASPAQCKNDKGWYANLKAGTNADGERVVFDAAIVANSLFVPSLVPSGDLCLGGGKSFLYCFNPFTGCACDSSQAQAKESAGIQSTPRFIAIPPVPIGRNEAGQGGKLREKDDSGREVTKLRVILLGNAEGEPVSVGGEPTLTVNSGRLSWREIVDQ